MISRQFKQIVAQLIDFIIFLYFQSAVKAKLIELGSNSGSSAGYIDDELPDYVMIMVANKRSKAQMTEDLKLFLAKNTEIFVNWLHQVLDKLQEVTLPASGKKIESEFTQECIYPNVYNARLYV